MNYQDFFDSSIFNLLFLNIRTFVLYHRCTWKSTTKAQKTQKDIDIFRRWYLRFFMVLWSTKCSSMIIIDFSHSNFCTFYHCHMAFHFRSFGYTWLHFTPLYPVFLHLTTLYSTRLWYLFVYKFVSKISSFILLFHLSYS